MYCNRIFFNGKNALLYTVGENIIATTKIRNNNYVAIQSFIFSNIAIAIFDFSLLLLVKFTLNPFWYQYFAFF